MFYTKIFHYFTPFKSEFTICNFHPLQAANCCRNSRFVADENDLKLEADEENILLFLKQFHDKFRSETPGCMN